MPLVIKELHIKITVNPHSQGQAAAVSVTAESTARSGDAGNAILPPGNEGEKEPEQGDY